HLRFHPTSQGERNSTGDKFLLLDNPWELRGTIHIRDTHRNPRVNLSRIQEPNEPIAPFFINDFNLIIIGYSTNLACPETIHPRRFTWTSIICICYQKSLSRFDTRD